MNKYISDLHFLHENIIPYTKGQNSIWKKNGFDFTDIIDGVNTIDEYDEMIISEWNKGTSKEDNVYILGDLMLGDLEKGISLLGRLNGTKHLITGNHDARIVRNSFLMGKLKKIGFTDNPESYKEIIDQGKKLILCHFPIMSFNGAAFGAIHLYGHIHNIYSQESAYHETISNLVIRSNRQLKDGTFDHGDLVREKAYNVGAMMPYIQYCPRTLEEIEKGYNSLMESKK